MALLRAHEESSASLIREAKIGLETLTRLYFLRHNFDACDVFLCNFLTLVANIAIESLNSTTNSVPSDVSHSTIILCAQVSTAGIEELTTGFTDILQGLKSQSSHYYLGNLTYKALQNILNPDDLARLGGHLGSKNNKEDERLALEHIQAGWPVPYIAKFDDDPSKAELRSFVFNAEDKEADGLSLDGYASSHGEI